MQLNPQTSESRPQVLNTPHLISHFTKRQKAELHLWHNHHTHTHTDTYAEATFRTFLNLTLSGGVWQTGPHKPTGHVDYHFNGLAR